MKPCVWFVTTIASPFWCEFARALNQHGEMSFFVAFTSRTRGDRGSHWGNADCEWEWFATFPGGDLTQWLSQEFARIKPQVVIVGGFNIEAEPTVRRLSRANQILFGYFAEQPTRRNLLANGLNHLLYRVRLASRRPRFILAVGDRAQDLYRTLAPSSCQVIFCPYYQTLRALSETGTTPPNDGMVTFLFSGRLLARNSIKEMVTAFERLAETHAGKFRWCVSAHGPEERWILEAMARSEVLREAIYFDRDFDRWDDRLRPFANSHVLLVPAKHSGWGLVVPEALAAGLPVITTRYVEAGRYYIDDFVNGIFVEPTAESILRSLRLMLDCPQIRERLQNHTRASALKGDAVTGADRLGMIVKALTTP